jgi:septum formation protein
MSGESATVTIVLASASPRRAELLQAAGIGFEVSIPTVDEAQLAGEGPDEYVRRVALAKATAIERGRRVVLAADTAVLAGTAQTRPVAGLILGKPVDAADAARMLRHLSGTAHEVLTGVAVLSGVGQEVFVESTRVWFKTLSESDIAWYIATGESADKAGAYAVQGLASRFVTRIEGSYSNVVGLPIASVYDALRRAGALP